MNTLAIIVGAVLAAALLVAVTLAGLHRVDETWRTRRRTCCRCRATWIGTDKLCRCGAPGHPAPPVPVRTPAHDWQGTCDTGPIPVVVRRVPEQRRPEAPARHRLREEVSPMVDEQPAPEAHTELA